jgi:hypothetical protein
MHEAVADVLLHGDSASELRPGDDGGPAGAPASPTWRASDAAGQLGAASGGRSAAMRLIAYGGMDATARSKMVRGLLPPRLVADLRRHFRNGVLVFPASAMLQVSLWARKEKGGGGSGVTVNHNNAGTAAPGSGECHRIGCHLHAQYA